MLAAGIGLGAAGGFATSRLSANTITGWSRNSEPVRAHVDRHGYDHPEGLGESFHDAHWMEVDAEAIAQRYMHERRAAWDTEPHRGSIPPQPSRVGDRLDWGLWQPLLFGLPAAVAAGGAVLATRTGIGALDDTIRGATVGTTLANSLRRLGSQRQGVVNSIGVGSAVTLLPLVVGGTAAGLIDSATGSSTAATCGGAGVASVAAGAQLAFLLNRSGHPLTRLTPKVALGMAIAAPVVWLAAKVATEAARELERTYMPRN